MLRYLRHKAGGRIALLELAWAAAQAFGARMATQVAGFLTAVLVARALGPEGFGLYSLMLISATLLSQLPGPGADMSAVRVSARYSARDPERACQVLLVAALAKAAISLGLALLVMLFARPLAALLHNPDSATALRCAALSAFALGMTEYMLATLQAGQRFGRMLAVSLTTAALELGPIAALWASGALSLPLALALFVAAAYAGLLLSALASWRMWAAPLRNAAATIRELLDFSRWLVGAMLLGALTSNLDVLALTYLAGAASAGLYNAGRTLTLPLAFAGGALGAVLLPRLSALASPEQVARVTRAVTLAAAVAAAIAVLALAAVAPLLLRLVYGAQYAGAAPIFQILTLAYGVQIITWPALTMLLVRDRPDLIAGLSLAVLCATALGYALVVPPIGASGAAWVFCAGCALLLAAYIVVGQRCSIHEVARRSTKDERIYSESL
jgi:O-antigen/teichoic acid export membrane protein